MELMYVSQIQKEISINMIRFAIIIDGSESGFTDNNHVTNRNNLTEFLNILQL